MNGILTKPYTETEMMDALIRHANYKGVNQRGENKTGVEPLGLRQPNALNSQEEQSKPDTNVTELSAIKSVIRGSEYCDIQIGNFDNLKALENAIGTDTVCDLIEQACESIALLIAEIRNGMEKNDPKVIYKAAHAIKGSSSSMFGQRLSRIALDIQGHSDNFEEVNELLFELDHAAEVTFNWWREYGKGVQHTIVNK